MAAFDYPRDRHEIIFITEADDTETRQALLSAPLLSHMRVLTVPDGMPRTKPRALNFALAQTQADLIAIYDAEDQPDPSQLQKATQAFAAGGSKLVCVQAELRIEGGATDFFSRHFAIEYATLFRSILPMLASQGWPIPLGGTSNHFRRSVLLAVGGWDAFNVTEDADLGVRLARQGYEIKTLTSATLEEAPLKRPHWLGQRTRWLKGWMQTILVHNRHPTRLVRQLGFVRALVVQIMLGGMILSALAHPWVYVFAGWSVFTHGSLMPPYPEAGMAQVAWLVGLTTLVLGYLTSVVLSLASIGTEPASTRARLRDAGLVFLSPIYWLAISLASYGALIDFVRRPSYWKKTPHAPRPALQAAPACRYELEHQSNDAAARSRGIARKVPHQ